MAKLFTDLILTTRIAEIYNTIYNTASKLHKLASSIGFFRKALHHKVTPKFAEINDRFINKQDQIDAERKLMLSHLIRHVLTLKQITYKLR